MITDVRMGGAAPVLVEAASDASLLVVGRRTRGSSIGSHIGSVTHAAMHHAKTPVTVVPHD
ncbi:universal stress protein [Streptomyces sp. NBC_01477]|uniref:universal stress protein n=1 Tax=Streptomyces sp. NBC_01477 TaxID=2976015 RepID=UPI002E37E211|nr:universal stress protein [Streptomyces sp. NBC_01477]